MSKDTKSKGKHLLTSYGHCVTEPTCPMPGPVVATLNDMGIGFGARNNSNASTNHNSHPVNRYICNVL